MSFSKIIKLFQEEFQKASNIQKMKFKNKIFKIKLEKNLSNKSLKTILKKKNKTDMSQNLKEDLKKEKMIFASAVGILNYSKEFKIGQEIKEGEEIGFIQVLKNKIPIFSNISGKIKKIYLSNFSCIEYKEPILEIE